MRPPSSPNIFFRLKPVVHSQEVRQQQLHQPGDLGHVDGVDHAARWTAACEGYAIAGTSRAHVDALRPLERRFAGIVLGVPQVVGVGDRLGGDVDVEYEWAGL